MYFLHDRLELLPDGRQYQLALTDMLAEMAVEAIENILSRRLGHRRTIQEVLHQKEFSLGGDELGLFHHVSGTDWDASTAIGTCFMRREAVFAILGAITAARDSEKWFEKGSAVSEQSACRISGFQ